MRDAIDLALNFESGNVGHNNISQNYGTVNAPITITKNTNYTTVIKEGNYNKGLIHGVVIGGAIAASASVMHSYWTSKKSEDYKQMKEMLEQLTKK